MEAPPDWDLLAVVRSCNTTPSAAVTSATFMTADLQLPPPHPPQLPPLQPCFSPSTPASASSSSAGVVFRFPNPFETAATSFQELQDICKPLICTTPTTTSSSNCTATVNTAFQASSLSSPVSSSSSSFIAAGRPFTIAEQPPLRRPVKPSQVIFGAPSVATSNSHAQRTKKRKNLMKKVCHVPAEGLSSDMWAWRKYGQKPIKGSPYPRGYYRCSSSKGCLARKQVERNRSDPKMFIVTYTAEHNHPMPTHRNSLAGSTRQKPLSTATNDASSSGATAATTPPEQPNCSSPSAASLSSLTEKSESKNGADDVAKEEIDEDNEMGISDLILNDDFYVGFEQIDGGDCFSDHFSPPMEFPWLSSNSGTAAAAGGS